MNTFDASYIECLKNKLLRKRAEKLVYRCGIRADLKGSECLVDAVILYSVGAVGSFCKLYELVGAYRSKKPKTVLREISYSISQATDLALNIAELIGCAVHDSEIHNSLVIAHLGKALDDHDIAL